MRSNTHQVSPIFPVINPYSGSNTDLYELTMGVAFRTLDEMAEQKLSGVSIMQHLLVHDAFFRRFPVLDENHGDMWEYAIQSGVGPLVDFLLNAHFTDADIDHLKSLPAFSKGNPEAKDRVLDSLKSWRFQGTVYAIPEGMVVAPCMPLVRVVANPFDAHLAETMIMECLNTGIAFSTKARRIVDHAKGRKVMDMSFRRMMMGVGGTIEAVRALMLGGFSGTSHVQAARILGVPAIGTHAHSWVMFFGSDERAFELYGALYPENHCSLVDTFDTLGKGVPAHIMVVKQMILRKLDLENSTVEAMRWSAKEWRQFIKANRDKLGNTVYFARNDSGDQEYFTNKMMKAFRGAGVESVSQIIVTNDLDEHIIAQLLRNGAKAHVFGVGTKAVSGLASLGIVYKLAALILPDGTIEPRVKSGNAAKGTIPYPSVPLVLYAKKGNMIAGFVNCLPEEEEKIKSTRRITVLHPYKQEETVIGFDRAERMLRPVIEDGKLVVSPTIFTDTAEVKAQADRFFAMLPVPHRRLIYPQRLKWGLSPGLHARRKELSESASRKKGDK